MPPAVMLREAVALLGSFPALAGIDLDCDAGEVVLLRGPNGSGKTTLLRAIAGLVPITSGTARVLGHDLVADRRAVRPDVWLVGHATGLYDDLSVDRNLEFWSRAGRRGRPVDIDEALTAFGLADRLRHLPVHQLSAGQRRRVALAVLVARRPPVWLLDEPHASLDEHHRDVLDDLVRRAADAGAAVVLASHDDDRASRLADRTVTLVGGRASQESRHVA